MLSRLLLMLHGPGGTGEGHGFHCGAGHGLHFVRPDLFFCCPMCEPDFFYAAPVLLILHGPLDGKGEGVGLIRWAGPWFMAFMRT